VGLPDCVRGFKSFIIIYALNKSMKTILCDTQFIYIYFFCVAFKNSNVKHLKKIVIKEMLSFLKLLFKSYTLKRETLNCKNYSCPKRICRLFY